ncbi:f-box domain-containing protein [Trichonephila inaurata madagascariensis]|uniref:F-box domain-containing protein n=1 Tax=Trichonephila inaurata madagascariensis TaxID=2747483 RepID=A0A8X7BPY3_9ARAC|nr:f-box domain-containing protein [Trichonephila inaurata madagascariensis]
MSNEHNYNILAQSYMRPANIFLVAYISMCSLNGVKNIATSKRKTKYDDYDYDEKSTSRWDYLPDILLEDIFSRLSIRERYYASQVCRNWNRIFYSKKVWETFILGDKTLTRRKFNYYMGDQYVLDHHRTQLCLHKVARGFRKLVIKPMENFHNLYEFMTILSYFCENFESLVMIRSLDFTFGCELSPEVARGRDKVFGTGGKLLEALKRLMDDLKGLKHLSLQDLLLEKEEAKYLLDDVVYNCGETIQSLKLINCSKEPYAMLHPVCFVNIHTLTISPQHLGEENVLLLANTQLRNLYLLQTKQTENAVPVSFKIWRECSKISPRLRVHHILDGPVETQVIWQDGAPIRSIIYDTPEIKVSISCIFHASNIYCNTLEVFAYLGIPEYQLQESFEDRPDTSLILLSRCCPFLDTLVIRDRISTATILLLASQSRNLRRLVVRRRGLIQKCDWPHNPEWSDSFYDWLRKTSVSIEKTKSEVSRILECVWHPLTEEEFRCFKLQRT